jgi:hypothetical protein
MFTMVGQSISRFLMLFFEEIRSLVCKGKKKSEPGIAAAGIVAGIAAWVAKHFGIDHVTAQAIGASLMIALVTATRGAFCKMTAEQAKDAIDAKTYKRKIRLGNHDHLYKNLWK